VAQHVDVGIIDLGGWSGEDEEELHRIRDEAARRGCDAVVVAYRGHSGRAYGTCVVFTAK
jgi:hypothetical protein